MPIAYKLGFTKRKRKSSGKDDANIKKQTYIDRRGLKPSSNSSHPPNPLIFNYPLPLSQGLNIFISRFQRRTYDFVLFYKGIVQ
jgi:hypothetical protein